MLFKKIDGFIRLLRPELPFAAGVCVVIGEMLGLGKFPPIREGLLGFLSGFFISGSAIFLNDYFDLEVDRVNAPARPIPAGLVSPTEAVVLAALTILAGLSASLALGLPAFMICFIFALIGFLYNWKFKAAGLPGNLMVSCSVAMTFILGGMAAAAPWNKLVWAFSLMAFFFDLGEEIAGTAMDMEGDKKRDSHSLAILFGRDFALRISGFLFALVILISLVPAFFGWLGISYLVMICITDIVIGVFTVKLLKSKTPEEGRWCMRRLYLGVLFGLLAFIAGMFFG